MNNKTLVKLSNIVVSINVNLINTYSMNNLIYTILKP